LNDPEFRLSHSNPIRERAMQLGTGRRYGSW
jgi:hypothetical protein